MYPKFIEVHDVENYEKCSVNIEHIVSFGDCFICLTNCGKLTNDVDDEGNPIQYKHVLFVEESYEQIKQLIQDCGCLIHKADPRLDTSRPLTLDDLKDMVGEPVWNSNINVWMLVKDVSDTWVKMLWTSGNVSEYTEDELIKYPVYRMRRV